MQSHELQSVPLEPVYAGACLLESPVGWKGDSRELAKHLESCDSLLRRGATHSARAEVLVGFASYSESWIFIVVSHTAKHVLLLP